MPIIVVDHLFKDSDIFGLERRVQSSNVAVLTIEGDICVVAYFEIDESFFEEDQLCKGDGVTKALGRPLTFLLIFVVSKRKNGLRPSSLDINGIIPDDLCLLLTVPVAKGGVSFSQNVPEKKCTGVIGDVGKRVHLRWQFLEGLIELVLLSEGEMAEEVQLRGITFFEGG